MKHITTSFLSTTLDAPVTFHVLLPERKNTSLFGNTPENFPPYRCLYLLHGAMEDAEAWISNTDIAAFTDQYSLAVILPTLGNTFYLDTPDGTPAHTFLTQEFFDYTHQFFPISSERRNTFIGGNSMGGFGAVYAALKRPDLYARAFSLSGAMDLKKAVSYVRILGALVPASLKNNVGTGYDLSSLLRDNKSSGKNMPELYLSCSKKDYFYSASNNFHNIAASIDYPCQMHTAPGQHDWEYWKSSLEPAIKWLTAQPVP